MALFNKPNEIDPGFNHYEQHGFEPTQEEKEVMLDL